MNEDEILKDLLYSSSSKVDRDVFDNDPTVMSLKDTIDLIVKKYGEDWRDYPECVCTVIWASRNFLMDHVKEVVPDLYSLCIEYKNKGTVNGKKFADNFAMLAFYLIDPTTPKYEKEVKK
jgi:hypothetical protein